MQPNHFFSLQDITPYLSDLFRPVLACSVDPDNRIRYFACESLYNIVKVSRADTMQFFKELFDALSKVMVAVDFTTFTTVQL